MLSRETIRKVKRIELVTRRLVDAQLAGQYHATFKGRGMDFDEVQPYTAGDDIRFIDWNVSARTGGLFVKRFTEERELTIQILVDASSSMAFGTQVDSKREVAAQVAAVLAMLATKNNDRVGLTIFDTEVDRYIAPKKGRTHVMRLVTEILEHRPRTAQTNLAAALQYVGRVTRRRSILFVISDFQNDGWEQDWKILARRHDVVPIRVVDPRERQLNLEAPAPQPAAARRKKTPDPTTTAEAPAPLPWWKRVWLGGLLEVEDLETRAAATIDLGSKQALAHFAAANASVEAAQQQIHRRLRLDSMEFCTDFVTEQDYVAPLAQFFRRRARRH